MRKLGIIFLLCLSINLPAQDNIDIIDREVLKQPTEEKKDSIFFGLLLKYAWSKPDSSLYYSQKEALLAKKLKSELMESRALSRYGYVLGMMGNYPQGIDYLLKTQKVARQLKDTSSLYWNYVFLTQLNTDRGDFEQAEFYAKKFKELHGQESQWFVRMASIYERSGRLDSALLYGRRAVDEEVKLNGKLAWSTIPLTLAEVYAKRKTYDSALHYYFITLSLSLKELLYKELIVTYNGIAEVYNNTGQNDSSFYYAYKSLELRSSNSYPVGTISTYQILYRLFRDKGRPDSAMGYLEQAIALKDSLFNQQKEREVQNIGFAEQLRQQDAIAQQTQYRNKLKLYILLSIAVVFIMIALLLIRNIRHRQKAFGMLQKQKTETDRQKAKAEQTLEELKSTQIQLIQSEKMASLGELTAGIAHEIQNPLNFVNNFSEVNKEMLAELNEEIDKRNYDDAKAIVKDVIANEEKINHHGKRADAIVKGMLQHSQTSTGKKEPTDINALCDEYLRLSYHGLRAKDKSFNADFKTDFDESIGKTGVVPQDLGRVLLNLFTNAFYSVTEKKKQQSEGYEPTVSVSTKKENDKVIIKVADNGMGIPQKVLDKIFQPFFTTKPSGQGTGLGLSLSYDIIKAHGGEITVETKEGEGSAFIIQLPV
ncbi:MAG: ATP-binding protein [Ferruginibacter sp.]